MLLTTSKPPRVHENALQLRYPPKQSSYAPDAAKLSPAFNGASPNTKWESSLEKSETGKPLPHAQH